MISFQGHDWLPFSQDPIQSHLGISSGKHSFTGRPLHWVLWRRPVSLARALQAHRLPMKWHIDRPSLHIQTKPAGVVSFR